jgi:hypothetical protein
LKAISEKRCKSCGNPFIPLRPLQRACSPDCAIKISRQKGRDKAEKALRQDDRRRKVDLRTISQWKTLVQQSFNAYIRNRDYLLPCVSCGTESPQHTGRGGAWDAGHYLSRGSHPELRYMEDNCAKQCKKCNSFRSGNIQNYRLELINRIGIERVEALEKKIPPKKYSRQDLEALLKLYKAKAKSNKPD